MLRPVPTIKPRQPTADQIARAAAYASRNPHYTAAVPCKKCGSTERYASSQNCVPCHARSVASHRVPARIARTADLQERKARWAREKEEARQALLAEKREQQIAKYLQRLASRAQKLGIDYDNLDIEMVKDLL